MCAGAGAVLKCNHSHGQREVYSEEIIILSFATHFTPPSGFLFTLLELLVVQINGAVLAQMQPQKAFATCLSALVCVCVCGVRGGLGKETSRNNHCFDEDYSL